MQLTSSKQNKQKTLQKQLRKLTLNLKYINKSNSVNNMLVETGLL